LIKVIFSIKIFKLYLKRQPLFFLLCAFCFPALGYVSIDVGKAHVRNSQMAIQPLVLFGPASKTAINIGSKIFRSMEDNLSFSGYFTLIDQETFLESPGEKQFEPYPKNPNGFIWKNWQLLNTDYLVLSGYSIKENKIHLDVYLYHVPLRKKIFQKKYSISVSGWERLAHKVCNDIVESLSNKPGIFLTKITTVRSTTGSKKELFIMDWNGKNKKQISFHRSNVLSPTWSITGTHIAYTAFLYRKSLKKRQGAMVLYNRFNRTRRVISKSKKTYLGSDFLPDGKHILLSMFLNRGDMDIAKMSLKDGSITPLTFGPNGSINVEPVVHPRGKNILFSSDRGGKIMIYSMNMNGKNIRPLIWQGSYNSTPDYSPDGKEVVFSGFDQGRFDIFIMNADGSKIRRLTSFKKPNNRWANNESPSFSPDGRHIVFTSNQTGRYHLYIMNLSNSYITQITSGYHNYKSPKWSPLLQ